MANTYKSGTGQQREENNHSHNFFYVYINLWHIAANQIKDIQQIWLFFCHKPYSREVVILHF